MFSSAQSKKQNLGLLIFTFLLFFSNPINNCAQNDYPLEINYYEFINYSKNKFVFPTDSTDFERFFFGMDTIIQRGDLPLGKKSIENGECNIEFPNDLPGDSAGNLLIIAKIVDHDDFANVEQRASIGWGVPVLLVTKDYNPFMAGPYIRFMALAIGMIIVVVFIISKTIKRKTTS